MRDNRISVVGAGAMGSGIAQALAQSGYTVTLIDVDSAQLRKAEDRIAAGIDRLVQRESLTAEEGQRVKGRIQTSPNISTAGGASLVIEAVLEELEVKASVFQELEQHCPATTVFASNTSTIPIVELAAHTNRPERFIGIHFMNPVHAMKLVEVVRSRQTSDETLGAALALVTELGKTPVVVNDAPGFVVNRLLVPPLTQACSLLQEGVASMEDIDAAIHLGLGHPMGPFQLMDLIGLDIVLDMTESIYSRTQDPACKPSPLLREKVELGQLGRKTGKGWYSY
jgi:3-hydroxybutyryl-CoA dehydrogenase